MRTKEEIEKAIKELTKEIDTLEETLTSMIQLGNIQGYINEWGNLIERREALYWALGVREKI